MHVQRCNVWPTRLPQILNRRGESASRPVVLYRSCSLLRAPRLRKLLARKRVPRTNGRRIRRIRRRNERTAVEHEQSSTGKNYRTHTHIFLILTNKRETYPTNLNRTKNKRKRRFRWNKEREKEGKRSFTHLLLK